jgi:hypothetical protein
VAVDITSNRPIILIITMMVAAHYSITLIPNGFALTHPL